MLGAASLATSLRARAPRVGLGWPRGAFTHRPLGSTARRPSSGRAEARPDEGQISAESPRSARRSPPKVLRRVSERNSIQNVLSRCIRKPNVSVWSCRAPCSTTRPTYDSLEHNTWFPPVPRHLGTAYVGAPGLGRGVRGSLSDPQRHHMS